MKILYSLLALFLISPVLVNGQSAVSLKKTAAVKKTVSIKIADSTARQADTLVLSKEKPVKGSKYIAAVKPAGEKPKPAASIAVKKAAAVKKVPVVLKDTSVKITDTLSIVKTKPVKLVKPAVPARTAAAQKAKPAETIVFSKKAAPAKKTIGTPKKDSLIVSADTLAKQQTAEKLDKPAEVIALSKKTPVKKAAVKPVLVPKIDSLITPTDTLVFIKESPVKLSKPEMLVKQATEKQTKPAEAIALYKKALAAKTKDQDSNWVANIHFDMAKLHFKTDNNSKDGFLELLTAQSLFMQSGNTACQAAISSEIASSYEDKKDWTEAEKYYLLALKQQEAVGLTEEMPYTMLALGKGYHGVDDFAKAEKYLSTAINQFELNSERNKRGDAYLLLLDIKIKQKNYGQAENLILKRALPYFSGAGIPKGRVACFNNLGDIYYTLKRYSEAKWFYIQANTLYRTQNDEAGIITSLTDLAKVKSAIGENKSALKDFTDAEALALKRNKLSLAADVKVAKARYYNKVKTLPAAAPKVASAQVKPAKKILADAVVKPAAKDEKPQVAEN